jgi:hypothetical protein
MIKRILLVMLLTIASAVVATAQTAALKNYYNAKFKVGLKYPANWKLTKEKPGEGAEYSLASVDPPAALLRGQLQEASVGLWVAGEMKPDKDVCMTFKDIHSNWRQNKPVTKKVGALTFYQMTDSDGGAGTFKTTNIYRIFHRGQCYNLSLETLARAPQNDRYVKAANRQFDAILRSFYFGK